ncbi:hypothetical protein G3I40_24380, partial [Streptomyces sp. SID14478]|nr:hypothetical protein [Streptomyces sp. SID14478]
MAAAVWFGQAPSLALVLWVVSIPAHNDYGQGLGGGIAALGYLCALVLSPPLFWVLGQVQGHVHTVPVLALGDRVLRRVPAPAWLRWALALAAVGAVWAVLPAALGWSAYPSSVLICTAAGVLPLL